MGRFKPCQWSIFVQAASRRPYRDQEDGVDEMNQALDIIDGLAIVSISIYLIFCIVLIMCLLFSFIGKVINRLMRGDRTPYVPPKI